jgi:hypothetical protein
MARVFISHSDKDRALADSLLQAIERRGVQCWIAPRDIPPGGSYAESIMNAIENSSGFILLYTKHSNISPHVLREVEQALRFRKNIMPIRFDDSPVSKAMDYLLGTVHWLSASSKPEAVEKAAGQIAASLPALSQPQQVATETRTPIPQVQPTGQRKSPLVWLAIVAIAVIGGLTAFWFLRTTRNGSTGGSITASDRSTAGTNTTPGRSTGSTIAASDQSTGGTMKNSGENILAGENGGQILVSANANWAGTTDGKEDQLYWFDPNDEGVYGFKGDAPARFGRFALLIPDSDSHNLKQFELLAGDESVFGQFRSLGKFTTKNARVSANDGYQEFSFAPVTAKYLKIRLISPYDPDDKRILLYEFRLFGELAGPPASAKPTSSPGSNLLSPDNGGSVAVAANDTWKQTIDDREDQVYWFEPREEAVYRFKNEQPVTFDRFSVLIPDNDEHNVKDFELLVGNESPTGEFRSIGKFKTHDARVGPDGYQDFSFPPVTAKYLKVRLLTPHSPNDPRILLYEFRLFGQSKD